MRLPTEKGTKIGIVTDNQSPFEDKWAVEMACLILSNFKPDYFFHLGDESDFYSLSKYSRHPKRQLELQQELEISKVVLKELADASGTKKRFLLRSNHGKRLQHYLRTKAAELSELRSLSYESLLGLDDLNMTLHDSVTVGKLDLMHGSRLSIHSSMSVEKHLKTIAYRRSVAMGHCHRMGLYYYQIGKDTPVVGIECGHLSDWRKLDYLNLEPNWQKGMVVVRFDGDGQPHPEMIPFFGAGKHTRAFWNQREWRV